MSRTSEYKAFCAAIRIERGDRCQCCGRTAAEAQEKKLHPHHLLPVAESGVADRLATSRANVLLLCGVVPQVPAPGIPAVPVGRGRAVARKGPTMNIASIVSVLERISDALDRGLGGRVVVTRNAPRDRRSPVPLSAEELAEVSKARNEHERAKIHRLLLTESMRRLRAGRSLEREHGVIHPEMTCIVRDVLRLTDLVYPGSEPPPEAVDAPAAVLSEGCRTVASLVARHGHGKVAARLGVEAKIVKAWVQGETPTEAHKASLEARFRIPRDAWGRT